MEYEVFVEAIKKMVEEGIEDSDIHTGIKIMNNGIRTDYMSVGAKGDRLALCVYPMECYEKYIYEGRDLDGLVEEIITEYKVGYGKGNFDRRYIYDFSYAASRITGVLVNAEKNAERLVNVPYREFMDLALMYQVEIEGSNFGMSDAIGCVLVTDDIMKGWMVDEPTILRQMINNMADQDEGILINLSELLECDKTVKPDMYVLTNYRQKYGAVEILRAALLSKAAEMLHGDFWLLPSSIHEWIITPVQDKEEERILLAELVKEINESIVGEEEFLSNHVYIDLHFYV